MTNLNDPIMVIDVEHVKANRERILEKIASGKIWGTPAFILCHILGVQPVIKKEGRLKKFFSTFSDIINGGISSLLQLFFLRFTTVHDEHEGVIKKPYQPP
jgi:hypothetical protein